MPCVCRFPQDRPDCEGFGRKEGWSGKCRSKPTAAAACVVLSASKPKPPPPGRTPVRVACASAILAALRSPGSSFRSMRLPGQARPASPPHIVRRPIQAEPSERPAAPLSVPSTTSRSWACCLVYSTSRRRPSAPLRIPLGAQGRNGGMWKRISLSP